MQNKMSTEEMGMVVLENQKEERTKRKDGEVEEERECEQSIKVTTRDRELVGHVALMRYAAERHLQRLVFGAPVLKANRKRKTGEPLAINVMRRRLQQLSRGKGALLRQVEYRGQDVALRRAYCVTALGYVIARGLLTEPPPLPPTDKPGDQHIADALSLNDLYVELATAKKAAFLRVGSLPFAWRIESIQLPWLEFNERRGANDERRLVPDGVLEIPQAKTRVFIEQLEVFYRLASITHLDLLFGTSNPRASVSAPGTEENSFNDPALRVLSKRESRPRWSVAAAALRRLLPQQ